ncbi:BlaI/MecI/CopY family transcriptional regulator [Amnibacterium endophyticum]|uniref:BlaI/MecI/CopY family transcriptional regulator n=1 Tax=Amnibacterium endophyticum TaxID=2109337 RepID=A0ABW4LHI3_9MICO
MVGDREVRMVSRRAHGALKSTVLSILRTGDAQMSVREVLDAWPADEPRPAFTTVITVLTRLQAAGVVHRQEGPEARFALPRIAGTSAADAMLATLLESADRRTALMSFAEQLDDDDLAVLRHALGRDRS